ncbi:MAG: DUF4153 domain-containing protein [Gemmatimonadota bacterium]|nr:DUF4153 domain-containing protein [Gemmatimonadota bacterium]
MIPEALRSYVRDAGNAFRQAPLEVALGVATAVALSVTMRGDDQENFGRFGGAAAVALPSLFALSVLRARGVIADAPRWAASVAVLLAAAAYGRWIIDPERGSEGYRFLSLLGAAVMAVSLVPVVSGGERAVVRIAFWRFNARLLARIVTVIAYGVALFAALAGAVAAVSALFDLTTPEHLYTDLSGAVFFALVPWVVVGGIPELIHRLEEDEASAPRGVSLLGRYLYAPVILVYVAILIAYAMKVLVTSEAPKNLLSPIILLAGLFGFIGSVFLEPLRRHPEHSGVARLIRLFPVPMLALLPFALWAVWVRRDQYGWTEFRYLRFAILLALAVVATIGVVRLVRRREPVLLLVPIVLGVTLFLSSFGPWGAVAVSRGNQQARLRQGLLEAGIFADGRVTRPLSLPNQPLRDTLQLSYEAFSRISGSLTYLYDEHGPEAVQPIFTDDVSSYGGGYALVSALRLGSSCPTTLTVPFVSAMLREKEPIPGLPAGTLYRLQGTRREGSTPAAQDTGAAVLRFADTEVTVTIRDSTGELSSRADLAPLFARVTSGAGQGCSVEGRRLSLGLSAAEARHPLLDVSGRTRGEVVITEIGAGQAIGPPSGIRLRLDRVTGLAVVSEP